MNQRSKQVNTADNKIVQLCFQGDSIAFQLQDPQRLEKYRGIYSYEKLPIQFKVLFENLQQFYNFVVSETENKLRMENKILIILVNLIGKIKQFQLPLEQVELTGEMKLRKEVKELFFKLDDKNKQSFLLQENLLQKQNTIKELNKAIENLTEVIKNRQTQNLKLVNKIRHLQNSVDDLLNQKSKSSQNNLQQSRLTEEYTPAKKNPFGSKSKKVKQLQDYGKKISFKLDDSARHFSKFRMSLNEVEKLHGPTYQLFHNQPLPKEGKFYFDIKIIFIKNNNIVVGLITDKNKEEQFSFKKMNSVCYNGYDGSICQQDKQSYVTIKPKQGNKLRTVIDMTLAQIQWYIMGGQSLRTLIGKANIPFSMTKQPLYPYFQLYWEGNKIKLNA